MFSIDSPSLSPTNLPVLKEIEIKKKYKDELAEWIHEQDPELSLETVNALPAEQIMTWMVTCPSWSHSVFHNWLSYKVISSYGPEKSAQKKIEETLNTIYQQIKEDSPSSVQSASLYMIDQLARNILKEYSRMIEEQATEEEELKILFTNELRLPPESHLMTLTINYARVHIQKIVRERLGYSCSEYPRESVAKVLLQDYPEQVSVLAPVWAKPVGKFAPIWEQWTFP